MWRKDKEMKIEDKLMDVLTGKNPDRCGKCKFFTRSTDPLDHTGSFGKCEKRDNDGVFSYQFCEDFIENPNKPLGFKTRQLMKETDKDNWFYKDQIKCLESGEVFKSAEQLCKLCGIEEWKLALSLFGIEYYKKINGLTFVTINNDN